VGGTGMRMISPCAAAAACEVAVDNRRNIHKIGVTHKDINSRLSRAENDPTYLFAKAELVAKFELFNVNCNKLETLLHRIFSPARLDIEIPDRFGKSYHPKEWFLVPLTTIQDAVEKIKDGTITDFHYSKGSGKLEKISG
jgi:hypothetical protein